MTDRELMQQALDALEDLHRTGDTQVFDMCYAPKLLPALRARLAQPEQGPLPEKSKGALNHEENKRHNKMILDKFYEENAHLYKAQPEQEPVAWIGFNERGECREVFTRDMKKLWPNYPTQDMTPVYTAPSHFLDPAKVARLIDEAFERGKKEIDMEQVKDIAQKLADCAVLNSAPPQPAQQQEPVAWMYVVGEFRNVHSERIDDYYSLDGGETRIKGVPLYTAPPQREWKGLTDEEKLTIVRETDNPVDALAATEAKLWEKNT